MPLTHRSYLAWRCLGGYSKATRSIILTSTLAFITHLLSVLTVSAPVLIPVTTECLLRSQPLMETPMVSQQPSLSSSLPHYPLWQAPFTIWFFKTWNLIFLLLLVSVEFDCSGCCSVPLRFLLQDGTHSPCQRVASWLPLIEWGITVGGMEMLHPKFMCSPCGQPERNGQLTWRHKNSQLNSIHSNSEKLLLL